MSDKKIVVPEGCLEAVAKAVRKELLGNTGSEQISEVSSEAFARWLSENPMRPSDDQVEDLRNEHIGLNLKWMMVEWQRRMFLAPEMKVPREILDLHVSDTEMGWDSPINKRIIEAYRRGQKSKESKL